ncbi:hypothetical protein [Streptomyces sp. Qhu_M48]|uniref:hypothetical protein n=1 Tax=Streptomyces sp. Qhu_M48 TaxID=3435889 RepID=UPI003F504753
MPVPVPQVVAAADVGVDADVDVTAAGAGPVGLAHGRRRPPSSGAVEEEFDLGLTLLVHGLARLAPAR